MDGVVVDSYIASWIDVVPSSINAREQLLLDSVTASLHDTELMFELSLFDIGGIAASSADSSSLNSAVLSIIHVEEGLSKSLFLVLFARTTLELV